MMLKVQVFSGGVLIGHAELSAEDPPMGVASGKLEVAAAYKHIRDEASHNEQGLLSLPVDVETVDGVAVVGQGGAAVADGLAEVPELTILGIAYPQYETWFGTDPAFVKYQRR